MIPTSHVKKKYHFEYLLISISYPVNVIMDIKFVKTTHIFSFFCHRQKSYNFLTKCAHQVTINAILTKVVKFMYTGIAEGKEFFRFDTVLLETSLLHSWIMLQDIGH